MSFKDLSRLQGPEVPESQRQLIEGYRGLLTRIAEVREQVATVNRLALEKLEEARQAADNTGDTAFVTVLSLVGQLASDTVLRMLDFSSEQLESTLTDIAEIPASVWESRRTYYEALYAQDLHSANVRFAQIEQNNTQKQEMLSRLSSGEGS